MCTYLEKKLTPPVNSAAIIVKDICTNRLRIIFTIKYYTKLFFIGRLRVKICANFYFFKHKHLLLTFFPNLLNRSRPKNVYFICCLFNPPCC